MPGTRATRHASQREWLSHARPSLRISATRARSVVAANQPSATPAMLAEKSIMFASRDGTKVCAPSINAAKAATAVKAHGDDPAATTVAARRANAQTCRNSSFQVPNGGTISSDSVGSSANHAMRPETHAASSQLHQRPKRGDCSVSRPTLQSDRLLDSLVCADRVN